MLLKLWSRLLPPSSGSRQSQNWSDPAHGGSKLPRNIENKLPTYLAPYLRRLEFSKEELFGVFAEEIRSGSVNFITN
jgi:hypothetical protein